MFTMNSVRKHDLNAVTNIMIADFGLRNEFTFDNKLDNFVDIFLMLLPNSSRTKLL
jgi:hypothetical protein